MADISKVLTDLTEVTSGLAGKLSCNTLSDSLKKLQTTVGDLAKIVKEQLEEKKDKDNLEDRTRVTEDELDDYKQKSLRGKFVITSTKDKESPMKTKEQLAGEGGDAALPAHIILLAKDKYNVTVSEDDISSCHYLPMGGIFFSLWNHRPGSVCSKLTKNIKTVTEQNRGVNVFINFMLTKRRSGLLYEVRQLKKNGKVARYYSDEEGTISIKVKDEDSSVKLTSSYKTKTSPLKTFQIPELQKLVADLQPQ